MKKILSVMLSALMVLSIGVINVSADSANVAKVGDVEYTTLAAAINAVETRDDCVILLNDCDEDVTISKNVYIYEKGGEYTGKIVIPTNADYRVFKKNELDKTINQVIASLIEDDCPDIIVAAYPKADVHPLGNLYNDDGTVNQAMIDNPIIFSGQSMETAYSFNAFDTTNGDKNTDKSSDMEIAYKLLGEPNFLNLSNFDLTSVFDKYNKLESSEKARAKDFLLDIAPYADWIADFVVHFDSDVVKESMGVSGYYGSYAATDGDGSGMDISLPNDMKKGDTYRMLFDYARLEVPYVGICTAVRTFECGAYPIFKYYEDNNVGGVTMTVELRLFNDDESIVVGTYSYTFGPKVAKIGDTIYPSLADAIAAVPTNGTPTTIKMIADETIIGNDGLKIESEQNIVLDLNGKEISNLVDINGHSQVINNKGTLTIKDSSDDGNGKITNEVKAGINPGDPANGKNYTTNIIENNGIFTIVSGNLVNTATGSACYAVDNNSADGFNIECYIKGGLLQNVNYIPVRVAPSDSKTIKFEMSGGVVSGKYGIVFNGNNATDPKLHFEINGGTVNASEYAVYTGSMGTINPLEATDFSFTITGGNFGTVKDKASLIEITNIKNFISGGWFSEKVEDKYVASGYKASDSLKDKGAPNATNVYTVIKDIPTENLENKETNTVNEGGKDIDTTFGTKVTIDETLPPEEKAKISSIQVSNLNKAISATEKNNTITSAATEAKDATSPTVEVEVIMNVELAKSGKIESLEAKIREDINAAGETIKNNKIEYIDITIDKIVKANGNVIEVKEIKETDSYQIISFPVASVFGTSADKEKVFVYRNHKIDENNEENVPFAKVEKDYGPSYNIDDGECYWIDGDYIYIKAKKFSVYGFGVQNSEIVAEKKPTPVPGPSPKPRYAIPNTGVEGTYSNNYSLLKLSSLSLLAIGTYMVIKKKKDN